MIIEWNEIKNKAKQNHNDKVKRIHKKYSQ